MRFDLLYELQMPKPHDPRSEGRCYHEALDQIVLADELGYDTVWEVEHHFLTEFAHSSAPEGFLAAVSQRTRKIRLAHGATLLPPRAAGGAAPPPPCQRAGWGSAPAARASSSRPDSRSTRRSRATCGRSP